MPSDLTLSQLAELRAKWEAQLKDLRYWYGVDEPLNECHAAFPALLEMAEEMLRLRAECETLNRMLDNSNRHGGGSRSGYFG